MPNYVGHELLNNPKKMHEATMAEVKEAEEGKGGDADEGKDEGKKTDGGGPPLTTKDLVAAWKASALYALHQSSEEEEGGGAVSEVDVDVDVDDVKLSKSGRHFDATVDLTNDYSKAQYGNAHAHGYLKHAQLVLQRQLKMTFRNPQVGWLLVGSS